MVVERASATEHSPFVLDFDECFELKSLPNYQLHMNALSTRTSVELLRADCDELLQLRKKLMRASGATSRSAKARDSTSHLSRTRWRLARATHSEPGQRSLRRRCTVRRSRAATTRRCTHRTTRCWTPSQSSRQRSSGGARARADRDAQSRARS